MRFKKEFISAILVTLVLIFASGAMAQTGLFGPPSIGPPVMETYQDLSLNLFGQDMITDSAGFLYLDLDSMQDSFFARGICESHTYLLTNHDIWAMRTNISRAGVVYVGHTTITLSPGSTIATDFSQRAYVILSPTTLWESTQGDSTIIGSLLKIPLSICGMRVLSLTNHDIYRLAYGHYDIWHQIATLDSYDIVEGILVRSLEITTDFDFLQGVYAPPMAWILDAEGEITTIGCLLKLPSGQFLLQNENTDSWLLLVKDA